MSEVRHASEHFDANVQHLQLVSNVLPQMEFLKEASAMTAECLGKPEVSVLRLTFASASVVSFIPRGPAEYDKGISSGGMVWGGQWRGGWARD